MTPRVVVVGLGPAGPDLLTSGTLDALARIPHRYLRTNRHPAASAVADATTFDPIYERSEHMAQVYEAIVDELVVAAHRHHEVLYAVPGSPLVAEHTVELLLTRTDVAVVVLPALSFLDLAWVRLGVDPIAVGARVVDGYRFAVEAAGERGPLLVAQCDQRRVLSDIKLAVDPPPAGPVTVLRRLGLPDESVHQVAWADLDRAFEPDHLTSLWIPALATPIAGEVQALTELVARLREECPWDQEQTHQSLAPHLIEETHEVIEVLDTMLEDDERYDDLEEELGDLLYQIAFHSQLATEAGRFTLADVARRIHDKLVQRHPHVFGPVEVEGDSARVEANWEQIKQQEKGRASVFDGIPASLPALMLAAKVEAKAARIGLAPLPVEGDTVEAHLLGLVLRAQAEGIDAEAALRRAVAHRLQRYQAEERDDPSPG